MSEEVRTKSIVVSKSHRLQDIYREREFNPFRNRYAFAQALLPEPEQNRLLADIGGGAGEFTKIARSLGYETLLVDGNNSSVEKESTLGQSSFHVDLNNGLAGLPNQKYDVVVCLDVIEHIVPAEQLLEEIYRILKPSGFLIISTPNFGYLVDRLHYLFGDEVREEGYHYRFFTKRKFIEILKNAGFTVDSTNSIGSALGINLLIRLITFGKARIPQFRVPFMLESWLASTFVYRLSKNL
jgi:2-polyprenyl-3-methyl-5-hydroxy-6-metoxy-1,4-benzoquinol methylase